MWVFLFSQTNHSSATMAEDTSPRMAASGAMELARHAAFQKGTAYRFGQKKRAGD